MLVAAVAVMEAAVVMMEASAALYLLLFVYDLTTEQIRLYITRWFKYDRDKL